MSKLVLHRLGCKEVNDFIIADIKKRTCPTGCKCSSKLALKCRKITLIIRKPNHPEQGREE